MCTLGGEKDTGAGAPPANKFIRTWRGWRGGPVARRVEREGMEIERREDSDREERRVG